MQQPFILTVPSWRVMISSLPPPAYPAVLLLVLASCWLEDASPKRRKAFFARVSRAIERHRAGEWPLRLDRPDAESEATEAEVDRAFVYLEAWIAKAGPMLED